MFKYIAKNTLQFFLGVLFVLVFVVFMGQFSRLFTYAMKYGADMLWVMSVAVYLMPDILALSIPISFQIAILMTLTSMSQSGEVMALRAAGFSFKEIAKPIFVIAAVLCGTMLYLNGWLSPQGRHYVEESKEDIATRITKVAIEPRTFVDVGDWDIFAENVDKKANILYQVYLTRKNDNTALSTKINSSEGRIKLDKAGINLSLSKGQLQRLDSLESRKIITAEFDECFVFIPLSQKSGEKRNYKSSELTTPEIIGHIISGDISPELLADYRPEPAYRLSMALAPLIFFFLSCPVAFVTNKKAGRTSAMVFSIVFIFAYFGFITIGNIVGEKVHFFPVSCFAPLLPVIAGAVVSYYLWRKKLSD
jgi:lipopolysaccharide export system permease protein